MRPEVENLKKRASEMYILGLPPTPKWWLERIEELLDNFTKENE